MADPQGSSGRRVAAARGSTTAINKQREVEARILYPALGFPEVIGPPVEVNRVNGTSSIHLLLVTDRADLKPRDVAWHLRYAPLSGPPPRYLAPATGAVDRNGNTTTACSFPANAIEVKKATLGPADSPIIHLNGEREPAGGQQVTFGRGFIRANISMYVLEFYRDAGLSHLYEVAIYEKAAASVPPGVYTLLWNNPEQSRSQRFSHAMWRLADRFLTERAALAGGPKKLRCPPPREYVVEHGHPGRRVELLHPLVVRDQQRTVLSVAHLTDTHVCVRAQTFEQGLQQRSKDERHATATRYYNNYNDRFAELYPKARASDLVLLTGDIVDFGRGHDGTGPLGDLESYPLDRNWFLFYSLLAGGNAYTTPVYTVLGNHDWRQDPYGPISSKYTIHEDVQLRKDELAEAHGPGATALIYGSSTNPSLTARAAEPWPLFTSLDSVKWYLLLINPFLDYVVRHPGGFCFLMLDWAKEEMAISIEELGGILPVAKASLSELQKGLVQWFLQRPESAKCVGLHAGIVSPGPTDDVLRRGTLVPCPRCGGTRTDPHARMVTDGGLQHGPRDCDCTRMMSQPASDSEPSRRPYLALNPTSQARTKVPDSCMPVRGTIMWHRDWFIRELMHHRVAAVFSGHAHRNALMWIRQKPTDDFLEAAIPAGTAMLVERLPLTGDASPPVFVNTSSAGPVGWRRPTRDLWIPEQPGFTVVQLRFDGVLLGAEYQAAPLPLRARQKNMVTNEIEFTDSAYTLPAGHPPSSRPLVASDPQANS